MVHWAVTVLAAVGYVTFVNLSAGQTLIFEAGGVIVQKKG